MEISITARRYGAHWTTEELPGITRAVLVIEPVRIYHGGTAARHEYLVQLTETLQMRAYPGGGSLQTGQYRCYLVPGGTPAFQSEGLVCQTCFVGQRKPIRGRIAPRRSAEGGYVLEFSSPVPLSAGELGLDYGIDEPYPLPETTGPDANGYYVLRTLLFRRPARPLRLWYNPSLAGVLDTANLSLNT